MKSYLIFLFSCFAMSEAHYSMAADIDSIPGQNLDEVVVTGSNNAVKRNLLPYAVSVVGAKEVESSAESQLLSVLSMRVPSLFVTERNLLGFGISNGGSGGVKIRGVGGSPTNAVLMMVDGQPQYSGIYSHHVADYYEMEYVDRVEVLRGPASILYGSNAMGGVVNIITKDAKRDGISTTLSMEYGSYNTLLSSLTNTLRYGRFSSLTSVAYNRTDGLKKNFDFNDVNAYAKVGYELSDVWKIAADYTFMRFVGNDPIYPTLANPESTDIYHQNIIRGDASVAISNHASSINGNIRLYYSYGNHFVDDPRHFHSVDDRFGILAYQNFSPWRGGYATAGFDFDTYTGKIPMSGGKPHEPGSLSTIERKRITEYSPYLTLSQSFAGEMVSVNGGIRMANSDKFDTQWVPQAGVVAHPRLDWTIKASIAKGYRNPSFKELYLYRMANSSLQPESMVNYEVGIGNRLSRYLDWELTAYYSKGANLIQTVDMKNVNTGGFINKGVELSLRSVISANLTFHSTYSYLHSSLANLTGAPRHQYFVGVAWSPCTLLNIDAQLKGASHLYVSPQQLDESFATLDVKMSYKVVKLLSLLVKFDNITNTHYQIMNGYDMPGFTVMGGFKINFQK